MLSQELIDLIIDELSCDKTALINVSSVSRSWVPRSRNHLFRTLRLLPFTRYGNRRYPIARPVWTIEYHARRFIDLCSHPHSTIPNAGPTHVEMTAGVFPMLSSRILAERRVSAFITLLSWLSEKHEMPGGERGLTQTNAHRLFWNVRHLTLSCVGSGESIEWLESVFLLSPFPRVTRLTIDGEYQVFRSRQSFSDVVSSFTSLKQLSIQTAFRLIPVFERSSIDVSFPLSLTDIEVPAPLTSLEILKSCSTLHQLTIIIRLPVVESECIAINQFLESSAAVRDERLKHCKLVLRSSEVPVQPGVIDGLSRLIHFNKVQSWTIDADCKAFVGGHSATMPNATTFVLRNPEMIRPFPGVTTELDGQLSELVRFPGLRVVEIPIFKSFNNSLLEGSGWDEVEGTVREGSEAHRAMDELAEKSRSMLPKCNKKGLLKVTSVYHPMYS
uniref:F-box domain-containing protein n=1 Tax=Moniliophthora roreri TaxID=221103 RepID=A0A0W0GB65_MONRR